METVDDQTGFGQQFVHHGLVRTPHVDGDQIDQVGVRHVADIPSDAVLVAAGQDADQAVVLDVGDDAADFAQDVYLVQPEPGRCLEPEARLQLTDVVGDDAAHGSLVQPSLPGDVEEGAHQPGLGHMLDQAARHVMALRAAVPPVGTVECGQRHVGHGLERCRAAGPAAVALAIDVDGGVAAIAGQVDEDLRLGAVAVELLVAAFGAGSRCSVGFGVDVVLGADVVDRDDAQAGQVQQVGTVEDGGSRTAITFQERAEFHLHRRYKEWHRILNKQVDLWHP